MTTPLPAADGEVGASRFFELLTAQPSPKALPAPLYVDGSVDVAVQNEPAMRARVDADVQSLRDLLAASAAFLRRATRVHPKELAPGTFGLGSEDRGELSPRGVVHLLGEAHARQALGVEVFHCDRIEALDDAERGLVLEVEAHPPHSVVLLGQEHDGFATSPTASLATGVAAQWRADAERARRVEDCRPSCRR